MKLKFAALPVAALGAAAVVAMAGPARPVAVAAPAPDPVTTIEQAPAVGALAGERGTAEPYRLEIGGHRGGLDTAPENTLAAVRTAISSGADAVELDVRFTADGRPIILHDDTLDRTTSCSGYVAQWKLSALLRCDAGSWFHQAFGDERVPTLTEALDVVKHSGVKLYLHVKLVDTVTQAAALVGAVAMEGMDTEQVVYVADEPERLDALALAGVPRERLAWIAHRTKDFASHRTRWGAIVLHCPQVTRAQVAAVQSRGLRVIAVEGHPIARSEVEHLRLDGFLADNLQAALSHRAD
ncbi:MAG: glycerophosphodiester phosphodiesterase [Sporichthyaceae bacterium]